jgi:hypothetical protein
MTRFTLETFVDQLVSLMDQSAAATAAAPIDDPAFNALALDLFALQFEHVPAYRQFCRHLDRAPDRVEHWSQIPSVPTSAFREFDLTSLPPHTRTTVFHSSGTTRQPRSRHFHSTCSLRLYEQAILPWFQRHLLPDQPHLRLLSLAPPVTAAPHSSLAYMLATVKRHCDTASSLDFGSVSPDGDWTVDIDRLVAELRKASSRHIPVLLAGTAYAFVHLLDTLQRLRIQCPLPAGSRLFETGGYKGRSRTLSKPRLHQSLSRLLDIPSHFIVTEYGMSELSSQAYDRVAGNPPSPGLRFPPWCASRVISPETGLEVGVGEIGLLHILDLANVYSLAAIQTEDLALRCEIGFEYTGRASGAQARGCSLLQP